MVVSDSKRTKMNENGKQQQQEQKKNKQINEGWSYTDNNSPAKCVNKETRSFGKWFKP